MPVFPFQPPNVSTTPFVKVKDTNGKQFSWRYRKVEGGIDCLVLSAKEASGFAKADMPVTVFLDSTGTPGLGRAVTGQALDDAVMAFVREDRKLWQQLAAPSIATKDHQAVTVVHISFTT